jgi:hypothetical protein
VSLVLSLIAEYQQFEQAPADEDDYEEEKFRDEESKR